MIDEAEQQEVYRIASEFFLETTGSEEEAQGMLANLANIVQEQGTKLVHLGNVLFLILVRAEGVVEVHVIGKEDSPQTLVNDFMQLAAYLKGIGVKYAYAYVEDDRFDKIREMVPVDVQKQQVDVGGKMLNVYAVEL